MMTVDDLLRLIDAFQRARTRPLSDSRISALLFNDGKRVRLLREKNGDVGSRPLAKAVQWFSDNWPTEADWPADVPRPASQDVAA